MKRRLVVRSEAEAELADAAAWYDDARPGLGEEFVAVVDHAVQRILAMPGAYPVWRSGHPYRKHVLRRFPYVVFFTADEVEVHVVAVAHTKRRPGYWLDRGTRGG
jgi:toxin ParE1/3/4